MKVSVAISGRLLKDLMEAVVQASVYNQSMLAECNHGRRQGSEHWASEWHRFDKATTELYDLVRKAQKKK